MSKKGDLERRLREIDQQIGRLRTDIQDNFPAKRQERSFILGISAVAGIGGLIFASPTSGLSLVLALPGLWLTTRDTMRDNDIANRARRAAEKIPQLEKEYADIRMELEEERRKIPDP